MTRKRPRIFLDTSVVIAGVLSATGGARQLFLLSEVGLLQLIVGPTVLRECEHVLQRKAPASLPALAKLLDAAHVESSAPSSTRQLAAARAQVQYLPDAYVLDEAVAARPDWFVTHDREHFLDIRSQIELPFQLASPGDFLQIYKADPALRPAQRD